MKNKLSRTKLLMSIAVLLLMAFSSPAMGVVKGAYLYNLSNFTGPIPGSWVGITIDSAKNEVYVADTTESLVRIFNESGMEIYSFGDDGALGNISDVAVAGNGDIFVLSYVSTQVGLKYSIIRCNFRGDPVSTIEIRDLPSQFSKFSPVRVFCREDRLYLVDKASMLVAVAGSDGLFKEGYDIAGLLGFDEKKRSDTGIVGFSVDNKGNMLFTIPVIFTAYRLSPDGKTESFGRPGSAPGRFNIAGGIVSDDKGYIYVTDTLRAVVMVFDRDFQFQTEFGYWGLNPGNLIAPMNLAVDNKGRVYVAQSARRGVSVFQVKID
jgi:DNA-binding beta-propeller fold protein YncE